MQCLEFFLLRDPTDPTILVSYYTNICIGKKEEGKRERRKDRLTSLFSQNKPKKHFSADSAVGSIDHSSVMLWGQLGPLVTGSSSYSPASNESSPEAAAPWSSAQWEDDEQAEDG